MAHPYGTDSNERQMIPFFIAGFAIVVAWAVSTVLTKLQWNVPWWVDAPSTMGFYGLFYAFFRKALWRWKPLHWAGVVRVPDLSGTWRGTLKTSFDDRAQVHDVTAQIQQDWTQMLIVFKGKYSTSKSVTGSIFVEDIPVLRYEYFNEPNPGAATTMHAHRGSVAFNVSDDANRLSGEYYSGRDRQEFGSIELRRV